jgi:uncharacterized membrane protein YhhN
MESGFIRGIFINYVPSIKKMKRIVLALFFSDALLNLWSEYMQHELLILFSKPLLMALLAGWFFLQIRPLSHPLPKWVLAGLIFSIGGDTLLMLVENGPGEEHYFLLGLGSFLLAQLCYLAGFLSYPKARQEGTLRNRPLAAWPFLLFLIGLLGMLWPGIGAGLKAPVVIYAAAIVGMALAAFNLRALLSREHYLGLMAGVLLFVLSDSLIAINKFANPVPLARIWIMVTYIAGQYFIARNVAAFAPQQK